MPLVLNTKSSIPDLLQEVDVRYVAVTVEKMLNTINNSHIKLNWDFSTCILLLLGDQASVDPFININSSDFLEGPSSVCYMLTRECGSCSDDLLMPLGS